MTLRELREVLLRVVDDAVCAERSGLLHVPRAADGGHVRAERLCDLHRVGADASGRAVDQNLLPGLDLALVAQRLEGGEPRHRNGCRFLERDVGRLGRKLLLGGARVFGPGAGSGAEHLVTRLKRLDVLADGFDPPSQIAPHVRVVGSPQPCPHSCEVGPGHAVPLDGIDRSRLNPDEHLVVFQDRLVDVPELERVRWPAVTHVSDCFHL